MLKIRLKLIGRKKNPFYLIVLMNSKKKRDGKIIKNLGFINRQKNIVSFNLSLLKKEIQNGAQLNLSINKLLINEMLFQKINRI